MHQKGKIEKISEIFINFAPMKKHREENYANIRLRLR